MPADLVLLLGVSMIATLASGAGTRLVLGWLRRRAILDRPNERSSHERPVPRGGGIAVVATIVVAWLALAGGGPAPSIVLVPTLAAAALAAISFLDDVKSLPAGLRLLVQFLAVAAGMAALPGSVFQGLLPGPLDHVVTALLWVWFVNLFNFMDGIDGIAGTEAAAIGGGLALVALADATQVLPGQALLGLSAAGAAIGFLYWNWHPARLFMGDVGSVPVGYLLGFLLLSAAAQGAWAAALLLPLYYLVDASWTLARRIARGAPPWRAHREHFYQRAVQAGRGHAEVVRLVLAADIVLVVLALWSVTREPLLPLTCGVLCVGLLLLVLSRAPGLRRLDRAS
jgi:UDP-N-acetylmuramyl pentapeptide phosphotransferase/UDP-N-acetylglucosamine-1-phosphate transferase